MLKNCIFLLLIASKTFLSVSSVQGQNSFTATWDFEGEVTTGIITADVGAIADNAVFGSGVNSITFSGGNSGGDAYQGQNWPTTSSVDLNDYLEVSVTAQSGTLFNAGSIISLSFDERRSNAGIRDFQVRASEDNFATFSTISTVNVPDNNSWRSHGNFNYTVVGSTRTAIQFRVYGYNAEGSGGTWRFDNLVMASTAALPVELTGFKAVTKAATVDLYWQTAQEHNSRSFEVERSSDGQQFESIASVTAAGTSLVPQQYHYTDRNPLSGINYYRLKLMDLDGQFTYSPVVSANVSRTDIKVFPTQANDVLTVALTGESNGPLNWVVTDVNGRIIANGYSAQQQFDIPVANFATGLHWLSVRDGNHLQTHRFFKQ
jgi:hypothetical protein